MLILLGIDTSCDDTSAALLECQGDDVKVISNIVSSQSAIHSKYGGIVPELASRSHMEMIWPAVKEAMGNVALKDLGAIAVCHGPGLIGSLLVGCSFAKSVCYASGVHLVGVNHLEGHLLSVFLEGERPEFPFLSLVVSGGHTSLYLVEDYLKYKELGRTRDDAAGEAYDKISKLLGLGYPGGPVIDRKANDGNPNTIALPRAYLTGSMDFSFSGLKTAVRHAVAAHPDATVEDFSASFQHAVVDVLVRKVQWAMRDHGVKDIAISGGVAANSYLRARMAQMCQENNGRAHLPSLAYCTDNAAMIAIAGYRRYLAGERSGLELNPRAYLPVASTDLSINTTIL